MIWRNVKVLYSFNFRFAKFRGRNFCKGGRTVTPRFLKFRIIIQILNLQRLHRLAGVIIEFCIYQRKFESEMWLDNYEYKDMNIEYVYMDVDMYVYNGIL